MTVTVTVTVTVTDWLRQQAVSLDQDHKRQQADHLRGVSETDMAR